MLEVQPPNFGGCILGYRIKQRGYPPNGQKKYNGVTYYSCFLFKQYGIMRTCWDMLCGDILGPPGSCTMLCIN